MKNTPFDGLITDDDIKEIKLLFYYIKSESFTDEDGVVEGKAVVELCASSSKFMDIASEINMKVKDIQKGRDVMRMYG